MSQDKKPSRTAAALLLCEVNNEITAYKAAQLFKISRVNLSRKIANEKKRNEK